MSLTLKAFAVLVQSGRVSEIPDTIVDNILYTLDTRSLLELVKYPEIGERVTSFIEERKDFYPYIQNTPVKLNDYEEYRLGTMTRICCFSPDVANVTIIQAENREEADRKAESFGIWFRDPALPELVVWSDEWMIGDAGRFTKEEPIDAFSALYLRERSVFIHFADGSILRKGRCDMDDKYGDFPGSLNPDYTCLPEISGLSLISRDEYYKIVEKAVGPEFTEETWELPNGEEFSRLVWNSKFPDQRTGSWITDF